MQGLKDQLCLDRLVLSWMRSSCCLCTSYQRHNAIRANDISQGDSPHANGSVKIVLECFGPFNHRQSLSDLWHLGGVATFLVFHGLPLFREILHDRCPLKISSSGAPANGIIIMNKLIATDQTLLRLGSKYKRWGRNHSAGCCRCRVRIRHPSCRA